MKIKLLYIAACIAVLVSSFTAAYFICDKAVFDFDNFIGKSIEEIEAEFGEFDSYYNEIKDGISFSKAGYLIHPKHVGIFGTYWPVFCKINFEDGIAVSTEIEVGGKGG